MRVSESIRIGKDTKEELGKLKIHPRETYDDVIKRLIEFYKSHSIASASSSAPPRASKTGE